MARGSVGISTAAPATTIAELVQELGGPDGATRLAARNALLAAGTLVAAHLLARLLGFYHSIVRYLGMGLLMAGAQVGAGSAVVLASLAWFTGMTQMPAASPAATAIARRRPSERVLNRRLRNHSVNRKAAMPPTMPQSGNRLSRRKAGIIVTSPGNAIVAMQKSRIL